MHPEDPQNEKQTKQPPPLITIIKVRERRRGLGSRARERSKVGIESERNTIWKDKAGGLHGGGWGPTELRANKTKLVTAADDTGSDDCSGTAELSKPFLDFQEPGVRKGQ